MTRKLIIILTLEPSGMISASSLTFCSMVPSTNLSGKDAIKAGTSTFFVSGRCNNATDKA